MASDFRIASQMPQSYNARFAKAADVEILSVPAGRIDPLPSDVRALIAVPFGPPGGTLPPAAPPGWPFALDWVHLPAVGIDMVPPWIFDGVTVTNGRGASAPAVGEWVMAAVLAQVKNFPETWIGDRAQWIHADISMAAGQALGVVGFGAIGREIAWRALAFGMRVSAVRQTDQPFPIQGVTRAESVASLFAQCDHVVLATPETPESIGVVSRAVLMGAKPGLHLVNIARGRLIDDEALLEALDSGRLAAASLDATHPEPLPVGHPFYSHPKIRLSPHCSSHVPETTDALLAQFADNVDRWRRGAPLKGVLDKARGY